MRTFTGNGWLGRSLTAVFVGAVLMSGPTGAAAALVAPPRSRRPASRSPRRLVCRECEPERVPHHTLNFGESRERRPRVAVPSGRDREPLPVCPDVAIEVEEKEQDEADDVAIADTGAPGWVSTAAILGLVMIGAGAFLVWRRRSRIG